MGARKPDQAVDAFSAPRSLLRAAQLAAKKRGMSKSGFYRYCLAKEVGFSETDAMQFAEHASVGAFTVIEGGGAKGKTQVISGGKFKSSVKIVQK